MDQRIKKLWIKALRSGKYKQGDGQLKNVQKKDDVKHCCLGVLEEIAVKEGVISRIRGGYLAKAVMKWAGLNRTDPILDPDTSRSAATLNDGGKSFKYIADKIETHL